MMATNSVQRLILTGLLAAGLGAPLAASAQDWRERVVPELVAVSPASGPAWWKVSKGDATVWIIGLPSQTPRGATWDQTMLKRRLEGARLLLGAYEEANGFRQGEGLPLLEGLLAARVKSEYRRRSELLPHTRPLHGRPSIRHVTDLKWGYRGNLTFETPSQIYQVAREAGVKVVRPRLRLHSWDTRVINASNPEMRRCIEGILREVNAPPEHDYQAAQYWAVGDVANMMAASAKGRDRDCELLGRDRRVRAIAFHTDAIAGALGQPGKVVAAVPVDQLVAQDGVLERLRAQGFTIHDPSRPFLDDARSSRLPART